VPFPSPTSAQATGTVAPRGNGARALLLAVGPVAATKLVVQIAFASGYGYFRDELYYLACARHLDWGYVDHPPLCVALLRLVHSTLGDSRLAWRLLPALAGTAVVLLAAHLARQMGGGRTAQVLAALAVLVAPEYLAIDHFYSMNAFEPLFWTGAACILAHALSAPQDAALRTWALLGLVLGLGLENKVSVLWLVGGLGVGMLATRHRQLLVRPGPWIALGIAALLLAPYVGWEMAHDWPTREFVRHATEEKMARIAPHEFILAQAINMHPLTVLLWVPGLTALLGWRRLELHRPLGVAYVAVLALLLAQRGSRTGYLSPFYPILFAAGGVVAEAATRRLRWLATAYGSLLVVGGAALAPLALPILPVETFVGYARALHQQPDTEEKKEIGRLPQFYADMFGWPEMTDAVLGVVASLSPDERSRAVVLANDYGQAGAFEFFGNGRGMPPVASGHNNYWLWGPGNPDADVVIRLSKEPDAPQWLAEQYAEVEPRSTFSNAWNMPYERGLVLYVCRHPRVPLGAAWPKRKHFD
jgi:hypothetical protein